MYLLYLKAQIYIIKLHGRFGMATLKHFPLLGHLHHGRPAARIRMNDQIFRKASDVQRVYRSMRGFSKMWDPRRGMHYAECAAEWRVFGEKRDAE